MAAEVRLATDDAIVVTGAGGFIGGHLVAHLARSGFTNVRAVDSKPLDQWYQRPADARCLEADLRDSIVCQAVTTDARWVFNLAADMGGMGFIEANRARCMLSVLINTNLLLGAMRHGVERYFFSSSACVYNVGLQRRPDVTALREEDAYPAAPEDGYGWEKLFSERMCRHFSEDFGLATRTARYHNVYGPHGTWDGGREKAPAAICRKVAAAKLFGHKTIDIWGDGRQTRSFTYIDDCVDGTLRIFSGGHQDPLNLGSEELVSIDDVVTIVEEIAGVRLKRVYQVDAPKGVRGRNSDNTLIREVLGWAPSTTLRDGLEQTFGWVYDQLRAGRLDPDARDAVLSTA
ncbi:MAG: NAD-dependent epimerase/dehydratase family protein [Candidatus Dormibacteraeota bacterium]|nr:NAD-dependent epimerase/dehydratase family protein [Candidatus Dormibacteraeota bacterium]